MRNEFDWKRFKEGEITVHCDTEEKAEDFLKICDEKGYKWTKGENLTSISNYNKYKENTCYLVNTRFRDNRILFSFVAFEEEEGEEIVEWSIKEKKLLKILKKTK